jgi:phenylalanyl-tRNA synthetase beta chain
MNIARTGRALGIVTDARYRFERGVDPAFCVPGLELATHLVTQLCGGAPTQNVVAGSVPDTTRDIEFPWSEVRRLTGLELPIAEMAEILTKLGFTVAHGASGRAQVRVPSWRPDVEGKADLVEEIVRIAGVDNVAAVPLPREEPIVPRPILTLLQKRVRAGRRALAARGLTEAVTWSFIAKDRAVAFGGGAPELALANPIAADLSDMRPSLLPGLIAAAQRNADHGQNDVALFEVGQIFKGDGENEQRMSAAALRRGTAKPEGAGRHWAGPAAKVDAFDAKADAMALLAALGLPTAGLQVVAGAPAWFHPGRSGTLQFGPKAIVGYFGELHPRILEALDAEGPLSGFEIMLDDLQAPKARPTKAKPKLDLPELMPVERDFAFVADRDVAAADVLRAAQGADRALVVRASVFDLYEGPGVPDDKKSIAIAVTLQPREKTLTDAEIEAVAAKIVAEVAKKTGASLRG